MPVSFHEVPEHEAPKREVPAHEVPLEHEITLAHEVPAHEGAAGNAARSAEPATELAASDPAPVRAVPSWWHDLMISAMMAAFVIAFLFVCQPVRVEGTSMLPQLEDQDRLLINKLAYRVGEIHRGDVVVFLYPHDHSKSYIKRVIALPGDDLRIDHGTVYVNGAVVKEPYVPLRYEDDRSLPEEIVPKDEYFVMGDHRVISSDSRDFGPVPRELIYGRAAFVYWPVDQAGAVR